MKEPEEKPATPYLPGEVIAYQEEEESATPDWMTSDIEDRGEGELFSVPRVQTGHLEAMKR